MTHKHLSSFKFPPLVASPCGMFSGEGCIFRLHNFIALVNNVSTFAIYIKAVIHVTAAARNISITCTFSKVTLN